MIYRIWFLLITILLLSVGCKQEDKILSLIPYFEEVDSFTISEIENLPLLINWEKKTNKYWIGETLINSLGEENNIYRVLALFEHETLVKLKFSCNIPEFNRENKTIQDTHVKNGKLIRAHLNSAIDPYKVWLFIDNRTFWLQIGDSFGARSGTKYYSFYFNMDSLAENL